MAERTQTLVQLTDELVELLDRRAARDGLSRSALIRELLRAALQDEGSAEISRRIADGYARAPQRDGHDAWGDLTRWTEANRRRNLAALAEEEEVPW